MNKKNILITTSSFGKEDKTSLALLDQYNLDIILNPYGRKLTEEEAGVFLTQYQPEGIIAGVEPLTKKILERAEKLKVISRCGIGLDNVDIYYAKSRGITILNTPNAPTLAVAELTISLILSVLRNITFIDSSIRSGGWEKPMGRLLSGKTVGIIGCGRIGSAVARLLSGFQCYISGYDPLLTYHPLIKLLDLNLVLKDSDIISIHAPYSEDTRHLINNNNIYQLRKGAIIINTSRGGIIDEDALFEAIKSQHIGGAGLDCFEEEPYKGNLTACKQVTLTSHIGSYAKETRIQMEKEAAENLIMALQKTGALS